MSVIEETLFQGLADWYEQFREAVNPEILQERNKIGAERLNQLMTENDLKNGAIIIGARHTLKFSAEDFKSIHEFLLDKNISVIIVDPEELDIKIK